MVLVTGASGFLGKHLIRRLSAQGVQARALYNTHMPAAELTVLPGITWVRCDLLDIFEIEEAMRGVTDVYHCAAIVSFDARKRDAMLHFNPESTAILVNQALEQGIRKLVYVSSVAALGRTSANNKEITEEQEWGDSNYNSAYGISKYMAEMEVWRGIGEGLNAVILNPGVILGESNTADLSSRLMGIVYKEFPFYSNGITSWTDAHDVVTAMTMLMGSDIEAERFIISTGNFSFKEIFTLMANTLGKKPPHIHAPAWLTGIVWRLMKLKSMLTGSEAVITRESVNNANSISLYNNTKFTEAFPGFSYTPIAETIARMARSFSNKK